MKLGLIAISGVRVGNPELAALGVTLPQFVRRGEVIASLPSLGLLTVAGLTPDDVDVHYREYEELPPEGELEEFDLVGISSFTAKIGEAYALADRYRSRGTKVVLGGLHVSALPEEAAAHADAVVRFGAEGVWPQVIDDFRAGELRSRYDGLRKGVFDEGVRATPRFDLLAGRSYNRVTVQTSRGCPWSCEFCAASLRIADGYQQKPVDVCIREIEAATSAVEQPFLELADDNTFVNRRWSKEFLRALAPLGVRWFTETDAAVADDPELVEQIVDAGCRQLLIGFESPDAEPLRGIDPSGFKEKRAESAQETIERLQAQGITVNGCFILGLDHHTPAVFESVRDFVVQSKLLEVQLTVLTPFPGTPLRDRLQREGRLLPDAGWDRCTLFDVNFQPKGMSVEELEAGMRWLFQEVYSEEQLLRRRRHYLDLWHEREDRAEQAAAEESERASAN